MPAYGPAASVAVTSLRAPLSDKGTALLLWIASQPGGINGKVVTPSSASDAPYGTAESLAIRGLVFLEYTSASGSYGTRSVKTLRLTKYGMQMARLLRTVSRARAMAALVSEVFDEMIGPEDINPMEEL